MVGNVRDISSLSVNLRQSNGSDRICPTVVVSSAPKFRGKHTKNMPSNTIQYAHAESKILIIQPPDWNQPKGYSAEIRVVLGTGSESEPGTASTIPGGRAFIRCESLFSGEPKAGLLLPLQIGDIVEFVVESVDVRILAVKKG